MRTTKALFWISDMCAWLMLSVALGSAFLTAAIGPMVFAMDREPVWPGLAIVLVCLLLIAKGAHALTQRRLWGLIPAQIPGLLALAIGGPVLAVVYVMASMLVFGLPLLLVFWQARAQLAREQHQVHSH